MARLIDADALSEIMADRLEKVSVRYGVGSGVAGAVAGAMALIDMQPAVEAIPVDWLEMTYPLHGVSGTEAYFRNASAVKDILRNWELSKRYAQETRE